MPVSKPAKKRGRPPKDTVKSVEKIEIPDEKKIRCLRCGGSNQNNFYQSRDKNRKFFGKIPYCKDCMKEMFTSYKKKYPDNHNLAFYYLCRKLDIPYIHNNYIGAMENISNPDSKIYGEQNFIPAYMKGFAFSEQNGWGSTFDESQGENEIDGLASFDEFTKVKKNKKVASPNDEDAYDIIEYDTHYLQNKWGSFTNDELAYLESEYLEWQDKLGGQITEKSIEVIVKQICLQSLDIQEARQQGNDVTKKIKTLRDLLSDGGLVEKQNSASEFTTVGQRIEEIEKMRPVYDVDPELSDVDGINKLLIGFIGCLSRSFGKENVYTQKFDELYKDYQIDLIEELGKQIKESESGDSNGKQNNNQKTQENSKDE